MIPALLAAAAVSGQVPALHLDNYTIPLGKSGATVGNIYRRRARPKAYSWRKTPSGLFTISKKGVLQLRKR